MDIDVDTETEKRVWIMCPKCNELALQKLNEYPIVCCGIPGMTFGTGRCCRCYVPIEVNYEKIDLCLNCDMALLNL